MQCIMKIFFAIFAHNLKICVSFICLYNNYLNNIWVYYKKNSVNIEYHSNTWLWESILISAK